MSGSVMLAVMTCEKCSSTLLRHWPWFLRQEADYNYVLTTDKPCECPPDAHILSVGVDSYISGSILPKRMIDSITRLLEVPWAVLILAEYDTVIFKRLEVERMEHAIAAHLAGFKTWGSKADKFYHCPMVFMRETAIKFVSAGQNAIDQGICTEGSPECSPDIFFGYVCEKNDFKVQTNLWKEYSRNSLDLPGHLDEARQSYLDGYHCIHGVKSIEELEYITSQ